MHLYLAQSTIPDLQLKLQFQFFCLVSDASMCNVHDIWVRVVTLSTRESYVGSHF